MATVTRSTSAISPTRNLLDSQRAGSGLIAGEAISEGMPCYIASDGLVYMSGGASFTALTDARGVVFGWSLETVAANKPITLGINFPLAYSDAGLTPGAKYYLSGTTAGRIATTAEVTGMKPCAYAIDTERIHCLQQFN